MEPHVPGPYSIVDLPSYAEVEREESFALAGLDLHNPSIDKAAVEEAVMELLSLCGARARPLRWFADVRLASAHIYPNEALRAYWPLSAANDALEAAWRAGTSEFGWFRSRWKRSLHS